MLLLQWRVLHGAPFVNLDFDMANTNTSTLQQTMLGLIYTRGFGPAKDLVPGWEIYQFESLVTTVGYNSGGGFAVDGVTSVGIYLHGYDSPINPNNFPGPGKYAIQLCGFSDFEVTYSMIQYGDVPTNAVGYSITGLVPNNAEVRMNDSLIGGKTGGVRAFAGQNVKLTIKFPPDPTFLFCPFIDSFQFITAPHIEPSSLAATTNSFTLSWTNNPFFSYQVEYTTSFFPAKWQPLGTPVSSTNGQFTFTDPSATNLVSGQRFYRLRSLPP